MSRVCQNSLLDPDFTVINTSLPLLPCYSHDRNWIHSFHVLCLKHYYIFFDWKELMSKKVTDHSKLLPFYGMEHHLDPPKSKYSHHDLQYLKSIMIIICEDILDDLSVETITRIIREPCHGDINKLASEFVTNATKIKTSDDMVEKGQKYSLLVIILGKTK